jgi:hypothetical protein
VPYYKPEELSGVSDSDRRLIARAYAVETRQQRARCVSGVADPAQHSAAAPALRRTA